MLFSMQTLAIIFVSDFITELFSKSWREKKNETEHQTFTN